MRGVTLDGAERGLDFYIFKPRFEGRCARALALEKYWRADYL